MDARADRAPARRAGGRAAGIRRNRRRGRSAGALGREIRRMRDHRRRKSGKRRSSTCWPTSTSQGDTPGAWGAKVGAAYRGFKANRVVAEVNNGGDMVAEVLRQSEPHLPVRAVTASRGKFLRAEPIAAAYERGLVFHAGAFAKLEDQLCALTPDFDRRAAAFRPTGPTRSSGRWPISWGWTGGAPREGCWSFMRGRRCSRDR